MMHLMELDFTCTFSTYTIQSSLICDELPQTYDQRIRIKAPALQFFLTAQNKQMIQADRKGADKTVCLLTTS